MDLRNLEMEEYYPPPDHLDLLEELKIPHHFDKLKELGYDDVDDFENVDITRFETACTGGGIPSAHIDKLIRAICKRRLCQPLTMPPLPLPELLVELSIEVGEHADRRKAPPLVLGQVCGRHRAECGHEIVGHRLHGAGIELHVEPRNELRMASLEPLRLASSCPWSGLAGL
ncbi:hypothetical protein T492DRAFT_902403 [Pavlovales sp. CCMP2436]|nr:hypothetical protein T492DRAFT_902403 [Pavlovales sp. CCMP2436]